MMFRIVPLLLILAACSDGSEPPEGTAAGAATKHAPSTTATRVEVATMQASQPQLQVVRPGEVKGAREAHLAAALGGFVEAVKVENGATVEQGQPIAYVDSSVHNAQVKLTRIEVDEAKRELARLESLGKSVASARVDAARTRLARAEAQHSLSRTNQSRAAVRAPFAGVIVDLRIEKGEVVAP
ncbi:MAG TPA: efflux RND transporter periplasmic adaptor subunit, partial [Kofleriaceae bacterium]|nr:efflux RND transporter periplasmic adaptor subunit [Kofleriaceae bacterium]